MVKKELEQKRPAEFFQEDPKREHVLYKSPGKNPTDVTKSNPYGTASYWPDYSRIAKLLTKDKKPYIEIHNHPRGSKDFFLDGKPEPVGIWDHFSKLVPTQSTLPSFGDLYCFMRDDSIGSIAVYQHNHETNEAEGMFVIKKTKETPKSEVEFSKYAKGSKNPNEASEKFVRANEKLFDKFHYTSTVVKTLSEFDDKTKRLQSREERQKLFDDLMKDLHLHIHYVPARGFSYAPGIGFLNEEDMKKLQSQHSLEQRVSGTTAIVGILSSLFFISSSVTGNAISNLSNSITNFIGVGLFLIGIASALFYFKSRR